MIFELNLEDIALYDTHLALAFDDTRFYDFVSFNRLLGANHARLPPKTEVIQLIAEVSMAFGFDFASEWSYDSSEDRSVSVLLASGGYGTLRLVHDNGQKMLIPYTYVGLGESKGADLGYTESTFQMDSSGSRVTCNGIFDDSYFPCKGYILSAGAIGAQSNGVALTEYLFGAFPPRAGVKCHGAVHSVLPGAGISCAMAFYQAATFV